MQNRSIIYTDGSSTRTVHNGSTNVNTVTVTTGRQTRQSVLTATSSTGDYVHPNGQSFSKYEKNMMFLRNRSESLTVGPYGPSYTETIGYDNGDPLNGLPSPYANFSTIAWNKALDDLYEAVRGSIDLAIDLLERESTMKMVKPAGTIAHTFVNVVNTIRRIKRDPKVGLDVASNLWLQYTYGIKPLVSTMYGFMEAFTKPQRGRVKVRGRASEHDEFTRLGGTAGTTMKSFINDSARCEHVAWLNLKPDFLLDYGSLSSLNPASIAWELVPYSFVADWVFDIGGYLRNLESAMMYNRFYEMGYSTQTSRRFVDSYYLFDGVVSNNRITSSGHGNSTGVKKLRQPNGLPPFPHWPVFNCDLGWRRLLSGASLMHQAARRV